MFPQNNYQAKIFFPLRVILNLSLPYHTSWCKHFVAIVFLFNATKSNLYLLSPISGLYECDIIYQDSESSVFSGESLFLKVSVFFTTLHSSVRPNESIKTRLVQKLENLVHIFVAKCHHYRYAVIGSMLMYTLKQYSDYVLYYCRFR